MFSRFVLKFSSAYNSMSGIYWVVRNIEINIGVSFSNN